MQAKTLAGPDAGSRKYDILTALGCHALAAPPAAQRLVLRFLTLVTARYNWRQGILHVGQREIARLWSVDERTVKREMAKLRALGWITVETPARRGRVASYALDLTVIRAATREGWARVGPDFEARMRGLPEPAEALTGTVVPFPRAAGAAAAPDAGREAGEESGAGDTDGDTPDDPAAPAGWAGMRALLRAEDPAVFAAWFEALGCGGISRDGGAGGCLTLTAPSAFHASYVRTHYADRLRRAMLRAAAGTDLRVEAG